MVRVNATPSDASMRRVVRQFPTRTAVKSAVPTAGLRRTLRVEDARWSHRLATSLGAEAVRMTRVQPIIAVNSSPSPAPSLSRSPHDSSPQCCHLLTIAVGSEPCIERRSVEAGRRLSHGRAIGRRRPENFFFRIPWQLSSAIRPFDSHSNRCALSLSIFKHIANPAARARATSPSLAVETRGASRAE